MANFTDILNRKSSEITKPKPLPVGTYLWLVEGQPRIDKSPKEQTDFVEFTLRCLQSGPDVDQQALTEAGGAVGKTKKVTFWLTDDALYRLTNGEKNDGFLDKLGIDGDLSVGEKISMAPGNQIYGTIRHAPSKDGQNIYANLDTFAKV